MKQTINKATRLSSEEADGSECHTDNHVKCKDITGDPSDLQVAVRGYSTRLYSSTFKNSDDMDKF